MRKFMLTAGALCILLCVLSCGLGPCRPVQNLPCNVSGENPQKCIIDIHCHVAGIGAHESGCFISEAYRRDSRYQSSLKAFGVTEEDLKKHGDDLVVDRLSELLDSSKYVRMAVVLAMDGVVTDGELDTSLTQVYVPNKFVSKAVKRHDNLLFGASVNPYRRDALEELKRVEADGAVLVKWIPSVMNIDPSDPKIIPFYEKLKELKLPLLTHTGLDQSFPCSLNLCPNHILADPERLRLPLKKGVKVIAAHVASTGTYEGEDSHIRLVRMMREYDNLYADISTLTQWNKHGYMCEALTRQEFTDRLYYGSDFPLINSRLVKPWYQRLWLTKSQINSICKERNPWDRDVLIKQALGTPTDVFTKSQEFLRP